MSAGKGNTRFLTSKSTAFDNTLRHTGRQFVNRKAKHRNRHNRLAAHSKNITHGIGCRNASEIKRIVHNRHEKVRGTDNRCTIT